VAPVRALFEKFTERSIKSVMLAQEMSRSCGTSEVRGGPKLASPVLAKTENKFCDLGRDRTH
jgi:hypothetical protein